MLTALIVLNVITIILVAGVAVVLGEAIRNCSDTLVQLQKDLEAPPSGPRLGRTWPTYNELEAARNRMDKTGLAHPGQAG